MLLVGYFNNGIQKQRRRKEYKVRQFEKNLNLTIIGTTRTLKIQDFGHK